MRPHTCRSSGRARSRAIRSSIAFPLETTAEELADLCGADVYRVYALDEVGKVLDYVVTVDVTGESRELRNAAGDAVSLPTLRATSAAPASDLRFALEAMTQMMRVNSDALRAVTETQADCVKAIVSVRGFFRNAPPPMSPEPAEDDDEEEVEDDESVQNKTIYDVLAPFSEASQDEVQRDGRHVPADRAGPVEEARAGVGASSRTQRRGTRRAGLPARDPAAGRGGDLDPRSSRRDRDEVRVVIDLTTELTAWLRSTELTSSGELHGAWFPRLRNGRLHLSELDEVLLGGVDDFWRTTQKLLGMLPPDRLARLVWPAASPRPDRCGSRRRDHDAAPSR
ncbi:MAG TPA: hypothetical protein VMJ10_28895 [Kofleriaceae bacterium]|nr:hypothetical protein [Kofleriaceae bacterium]